MKRLHSKSRDDEPPHDTIHDDSSSTDSESPLEPQQQQQHFNVPVANSDSPAVVGSPASSQEEPNNIIVVEDLSSNEDDSDGWSDAYSEDTSNESGNMNSSDFEDDDDYFNGSSDSEDDDDISIDSKDEMVTIFLTLKPVERELDQKYKQILRHRYFEKNKKTVVKTLENLSMDSVIKILSSYISRTDSSAEVSPLEGLPGPLLTKLIHHMSDEDLSHFDIVKLLITEASQELSVTLEDPRLYRYQGSPWTQEKVDIVCNLFAKCKNRLTKLKITVEYYSDNVIIRPNVTQLNDIVRHQSNLCELTLSACDITNDTMAIIGSTCPNLSCLSIPDNLNVDDTGLLYLCVSEHPHGVCTKLKRLDLVNTQTTPSAIAIVITKLPELKHINLDGSKLCTALCNLHHSNPNLKLKLEIFECHDLCNQNHEIFLHMLPEMKRYLGNMSLSSSAIVKLPQLEMCRIPKMTSYDINFPILISHVSSTLVKVYLGEVMGTDAFTVDLSLFAMCPNLIEIHLLNCVIPSQTKYELLPSSFQKIKNFLLQDTDGEMIPEKILTRVLCCKYLEKFESYYIKISEDYLISIINISRTDRNIFSNLKQIEFPRMTKYSLDTWINFMCVIPDRVRIVNHGKFSSEDKELLHRFAVRNYIKVKLCNKMFNVDDAATYRN